MNKEINQLKLVWETGKKTANQNTELQNLDFDSLISSIISIGPFYFYIIDFFDMSLSHVSPNIYDIHGFDPENVTFNDIIGTIHPDDIAFVSNAEAYIMDFVYSKLDKKHVLNYKTNYSFRSKMKNGHYELLNHQAIVLTVDDDGNFGKALNIHTNVNHINSRPNNKFSLLSLNCEPSFINMEVSSNKDDCTTFTKREVEIIKGIAEGHNNNEIAESLFISPLTVKKHRRNILNKSNCKNTSQLIKESILKGLI